MFEKCFPNLGSSYTCVDFKLVFRTAWKTARHPSIILDILKRLLFEIKERNKKSPNQEIFTIDEIENFETNPKFHYNSKIISVLLLYFSSLFTVIIWPRYLYLDSIDANAFDINFAFFFLAYLLFFFPCCMVSILVLTKNHLSEEEIVSFLSSSPECVLLSYRG